MKPQDGIFLLTVLLLMVIKRQWLWQAGIISCLLSGMLFLGGNLFTAQRLSWYAAGFLFSHVLFQLKKSLYDRPLP